MNTITKDNIDTIITEVNRNLSDDLDCVLLFNSGKSKHVNVLIVKPEFVENNIEIIKEKQHCYKFIFISQDYLFSKLLEHDLYLAELLSKSVIIRDYRYIMKDILNILDSIVNNSHNSNSCNTPNSLLTYYLECLKENNDEKYFLKLISMLLEIGFKNTWDVPSNHTFVNDIFFKNISLSIEMYYSHKDYTFIENIISQILTNDIQKEKLNDNCDNEFTIFFEGSYKYTDFIESIFINISKGMTPSLIHSEFTIEKVWKKEFYSVGILLTYYFDNMDMGSFAFAALKQKLFKEVTELKLNTIHFSQKKRYISLNDKEEKITLLERQIFKTLSSDLILTNSKTNLSDNQLITLCIYYYIVSGIFYYKDREVFLMKTNDLYNLLISQSISNNTSTLIGSTSNFEIKEKLNNEYSTIISELHTSLDKNYSKLLSSFDKRQIESFDFLSKLEEIYKIIEKSNNTLQAGINNNTDKIDSFFISFFRKSLNLFFIDNYYKAFIPYVIKSLLYEKI